MGSDFGNFIDEIARRGYQNQEQNENDFVDSDGLMHCGKCGEKKETYVKFNFTGKPEMKKVPCSCLCIRKKQEEERKAEQAREDMMILQKIREASLMDEKFRDATFRSFQKNGCNEKNLKLCERYCTTFSKMLENNQGLLFWGEVGTGKSFAAACIANYLMDHKIPVMMTSFVKLLELIQTNSDQESEIIRRMGKAKLVIFDDLGAERNTDYALEKVYNIIDSRYRARLPTLLTTNLTMNDMLNESDIRYRRIYDRIFEACYPMQFTGPSWRKKMAGSRFEEMERLLNGND